jgi:hypothetical protein
MGGQWLGEGMPSSNLQCFLDCTTPTVETHILPKVTQLPPTSQVLAFDVLPGFWPGLATVVASSICGVLASWESRICHLLLFSAPLSVVG